MIPRLGIATHSSILAWRIPGLYSPWDRKELDTTERLSFPPFSETTVEKLIWIGDLIAASLSLFKNFDCYDFIWVGFKFKILKHRLLIERII